VGPVRVLLDRLDDRELSERYAGQAIEYGWSRAVSEHQLWPGDNDAVG
jgi:hypothetical protein